MTDKLTKIKAAAKNGFLPCLFCGKPDAKIIKNQIDSDLLGPDKNLHFRARCEYCGAQTTTYKTSAAAIAAWNTRTPAVPALCEALEVAMALLDMAICPNCDGSGSTARQVSSRQYVTREMAIDGGDPDLEGSLYSDDEWEQEQCQWCFEKARIDKILEGAG